MFKVNALRVSIMLHSLSPITMHLTYLKCDILYLKLYSTEITQTLLVNIMLFLHFKKENIFFIKVSIKKGVFPFYFYFILCYKVIVFCCDFRLRMFITLSFSGRFASPAKSYDV